MKGLFTSTTTCFLLILFPSILNAAAGDSATASLVGTISYEVEYDDFTTPMRYYSDGERLKIELGEAGDPYLVWIRGTDGIDGVAVLSPLQKKYSVEFDGPPMHDLLRSDGSIEKRRKPKEVTLPAGKPAELKGFNCVKYELDTDGPDTTVWMLDNAQRFPFQVTQVWKTLYDAAPHIRKLAEKHNGIPLKIERKNWRGKAYFSLEFIAHDPEKPSIDAFKIPGDYYQIASQVRGARRPGQEGGGGEGRGPGG